MTITDSVSPEYEAEVREVTTDLHKFRAEALAEMPDISPDHMTVAFLVHALAELRIRLKKLEALEHERQVEKTDMSPGPDNDLVSVDEAGRWSW